jgi:tetratricopeptide (TPR) repeat protein
LAQFFITAIPVIGLVPFNYQDYSYVADRFLYLSCIGGGVVAGAVAERLARGRSASRRRLGVVGVFIVLAGSALLSYRQALHWRSNLSFWTYAFERNPESYPPNIKLGAHYAAVGQWPEALGFYQKAHQLEPELNVALRLYLEALGTVRGPHAVIEACGTAIQQRYPNAYVAFLYRAMSYETLGRRAEAIADYGRVLALTAPGSTPWQQARQGRAPRAPGPRAGGRGTVEYRDIIDRVSTHPMSQLEERTP